MFSIVGLLLLKLFSLLYLNFLAYLLGHCCMSFKFNFSFCVNYGLDKKREKPFLSVIWLVLGQLWTIEKEAALLTQC